MNAVQLKKVIHKQLFHQFLTECVALNVFAVLFKKGGGKIHAIFKLRVLFKLQIREHKVKHLLKKLLCNF